MNIAWNIITLTMHLCLYDVIRHEVQGKSKVPQTVEDTPVFGYKQN